MGGDVPVTDGGTDDADRGTADEGSGNDLTVPVVGSVSPVVIAVVCVGLLVVFTVLAPIVAIVGGAVFGASVVDFESTSTDPPTASFEFDHSPEDGRVTIVHTGGETFDADNTDFVTVNVDGGTVKRIELPFAVGDSVGVTDVSSGDRVTVEWWAPADGGGSAVVASFTVP